MTAIFCTRCGAEANASCNCGVDYKPKSVRAAEAIKLDPGKSDRAIAAEIGVSDMTVGRARKSGATSVAPEKRTGKDGKNYPAAKPRRLGLLRLAKDRDKAAKVDKRISELVRIVRAGLAKTTAVPKEDLLFLSNCLKDLAGEMAAPTSAVA